MINKVASNIKIKNKNNKNKVKFLEIWKGYYIAQNGGGENFGEMNVICQNFTQPHSRPT